MLKPLVLLCALVAFALSTPQLNAQSTAMQVQTSTPVFSNQQRVSALEAAKARFKAGDISGGETALFAVNREGAGTSEGYRESGQALIGMACMFEQDRDGATAMKLGNEALAQLKLALANAGSNKKLIGNIYMLMGFTQERVAGTRAQAEASYSMAVQYLPPGGHVAKVLRRMQEEDAILATRGKPAVAAK